MILQQCRHGHYFNSDKFAECPYCSLEKSVIEEKTEEWSKNAYEATETIVGQYDASKSGSNR